MNVSDLVEVRDLKRGSKGENMVDVIITHIGKNGFDCVDAIWPTYESVIITNHIDTFQLCVGDRVRITNLIRKRSLIWWWPVLLTTSTSKVYESRVIWEESD